MYDKTDAAKDFRRYCGVTLAWWHTYKWASHKLVNVFAKDFIAPLFHHLFPSTEFNADKMKLSGHTTLLSYIRLAFPSFRQELKLAVSRGDISQRNQILLENLIKLCEYFIPVVIICVFVGLSCVLFVIYFFYL